MSAAAIHSDIYVHLPCNSVPSRVGTGCYSTSWPAVPGHAGAVNTCGNQAYRGSLPRRCTGSGCRSRPGTSAAQTRRPAMWHSTSVIARLPMPSKVKHVRPRQHGPADSRSRLDASRLQKVWAAHLQGREDTAEHEVVQLAGQALLLTAASHITQKSVEASSGADSSAAPFSGSKQLDDAPTPRWCPSTDAAPCRGSSCAQQSAARA